jgi:hypothetical protein
MFRFSIIVLLVLVIPFGTYAQFFHSDSTAQKREILYRGFYQNGKVFQTNDFLNAGNQIRDDIDLFHSLSFQALWQTNGSHQWEKDFGFPRLGVGIWCARFFDAPDLGTPIAVYGLFNAPFKSGKNWRWTYEFEMGLAMNWGAFNPITNSTNVAMGDDESVFLDLGSYFEYQISPKTSLEFGVSLSHFSNGALKLPNLGINTIAPKLIFQYRPFETKYIQNQVLDKSKKSKYEYQVDLYYGVKNVIYTGNDVDTIAKYNGVYFPQTGILTSVHRLVGKKSKFGLGLGFDYNGAAYSRFLIDGDKPDEQNATLKEGFELSLFPSYEFVIDRASVIFQPAIYLYRQKYDGRRPVAYQRVGLKYHITENIFAGINLRAYDYYRSDFIEWNIGYRFN